jgi:hypothetical protein
MELCSNLRRPTFPLKVNFKKVIKLLDHNANQHNSTFQPHVHSTQLNNVNSGQLSTKARPPEGWTGADFPHPRPNENLWISADYRCCVQTAGGGRDENG